jgi:hypothetical protein
MDYLECRNYVDTERFIALDDAWANLYGGYGTWERPLSHV